MNMMNYLVLRDALEMASRMALQKRACNVLALARLWSSGRIGPSKYQTSDSGNADAATFCAIFNGLPKDIRQNVVLRAAVEPRKCSELHKRAEESREYLMCMDTVRVWMRCTVLDRRMGTRVVQEKEGEQGKEEPVKQVFVHYETWTERWDEWLDEGDTSRVLPWVEPCVDRVDLARLSNVQIGYCELEILDMLRNGSVDVYF
jgi:hypothetical protein